MTWQRGYWYSHGRDIVFMLSGDFGGRGHSCSRAAPLLSVLFLVTVAESLEGMVRLGKQLAFLFFLSVAGKGAVYGAARVTIKWPSQWLILTTTLISA